MPDFFQEICQIMNPSLPGYDAWRTQEYGHLPLRRNEDEVLKSHYESKIEEIRCEIENTDGFPSEEVFKLAKIPMNYRELLIDIMAEQLYQKRMREGDYNVETGYILNG